MKPIGWNSFTYGILYGSAELTQQAKGIYSDVRFSLKQCLNIEIIFQ